MARKHRRKAGGPLTIDQLLEVGDSVFKLQKFHARQAEGTGHLITKMEGVADFTPDLYIVSGAARDQMRAFVAKMIADEAAGVNELKRLYSLEGDN